VEQIRASESGIQRPSKIHTSLRAVAEAAAAWPPADKPVLQTCVFSQIDWMPWAPFHTRLLLTLAAAWASVGLQVALVLILKGTMVESLGAGTTDLSIALTLSLLGTALGALALGRLADRLGRRLAFFMSIALCALGAALTPFFEFFDSIAMLDVSRLVAGVGVGGACVAVNATVQEFMPALRRGWACLAANASFWLGAALAALGSVWLFASPDAARVLDGSKIAFWASAALCLLVLPFLLRWVPESPRWLVTQGRTKEAEEIVEEIKASLPLSTTVLLPIARPVSFDTRLGRPTLIEVGRIMYRDHWRALLLCFALMSVQAFFYNAFFFGHVDVLQKQLAFDPTGIGWHLLPIALGNFLGPILLGPLVDGRRGRRQTMTMTFGVSGALLFITALLFGLSGGGGPIGFSPVLFTVAWTVIFFFTSTAASTAYLTSGELFPLEIRALAFAVVFAGSMGVGGVLSPWLFDLVVNVKSPTMIACVYAFAAVLMIVVAIAVAPVVWQRRRRPVVILPPYQIPSRVLPELSRKPVEATVRPISAA
jgi:MFS family permease